MGWGFKDKGPYCKKRVRKKVRIKINSLLNNLDQQVNGLLICQP